MIPWTAIRRYAETYGMSFEEFDEFLAIIRSMEDGREDAQAAIQAERVETDKG
jgi:hypothetical protein